MPARGKRMGMTADPRPNRNIAGFAKHSDRPVGDITSNPIGQHLCCVLYFSVQRELCSDVGALSLTNASLENQYRAQVEFA